MRQCTLSVADIFWAGDVFRPAVDAQDLARLPADLAGLSGQFALALPRPGGETALVRDKYGINKLFFAVHEDGSVLTSNHLVELIDEGVPFAGVFSVPAGHFAVVDGGARTCDTFRYHALESAPGTPPSLPLLGKQIRAVLELWFRRLALAFADREICLCLSGGLDSSLVAALACRHFEHVTAYTYSFVSDGHPKSEDAQYAQRVAAHLGIPIDIIPATADDILDALEDALIFGQDWREFNVHCAVVNELLGRHLAAHGSVTGRARLLLTGDMMNEIVADYTPVSYGGREYYALPDMDADQLRLLLIKGLDAGDREIGVFSRHGLDCVQPYGLVLEEYLRVRGAALKGEVAKQALVSAIGGDLLPDFILNRPKVRAQIGCGGKPTGILPVLARNGRDSDWFREAWRKRLGIASAKELDRFIRVGRYRMAPPQLDGKGQRGYLIA